MKKRVLIVDDDPDILNILSEIFIAAGDEVKAVLNTGDILELTESFKPDVIILDYILEGINGGELCAQVKNSSKFNHIPVIIISAYPKVLLSLGTYKCDMVIPKPFDIYDLLSKVDHVMEYAI